MASRYKDAFDLEEQQENALFISGVEQVGAKRSKYIYDAKRRKALIIGGSILGGVAALALIIGLVYGLRHRKINYQCPSGVSSSDIDLAFFIVGDWGRSNNNQAKVANMMTGIAGCLQPSFIISTGDNFYEHGLRSPNDPYFKETFTYYYSSGALQDVPWYAVLGNHDYGELTSTLLTECAATTWDACPSGCCFSPLWQVSASNSNLDPRWTLQQGAWKRTFLNGQLDIVFVDTNPYIEKYQTASWANITGGISSQDYEAQRVVIKQLLSNSTAPWKLVVGHHGIRSYGEHCMTSHPDCQDMVWLRPWLRQYKVAAYFNGHDHDLQLIKDNDDPVYYITSGAGSDIRQNEFDNVDVSSMGADFFADDQGFVLATIKGKVLTLYFYTSKSATYSYVQVINQPT